MTTLSFTDDELCLLAKWVIWAKWYDSVPFDIALKAMEHEKPLTAKEEPLYVKILAESMKVHHKRRGTAS